ncbi:MAG: prolyl oligopeptidase family serine peptidase [Bacteroidetes bacterium]|jgi:dipeptidyl aminopeptidase/acylaminoacyl peptidase|nr:prolyl oligopeptidase family serine peptidase [Bacteroidota bacterium]
MQETLPNESQKRPGDPTLPNTEAELERLIGKEEGTYKYSVEDFFRNPERVGFQLSQNGDYLAYAGPHERRQNIFVQPVDGGDPVRITSETERDIAGYFWANNNRIVYVKDSGGDENFQLFAVDRDGSNPRDLTPFDGVKIDLIDDLEDQDDELIIGMNKNNPMLFEPYRINVQTGETTKLAANDNPAEPITSWMTDHAGRLRIAIKTIEGVNQHIMYRATEEAPFETVVKTNFKESLDPLLFDFDDGDVVFCLSNIGRDRSEIIRYDFARNQEVGEPIFSHPEVDAGSLMYSRKRKVLTGAVYTTWKRQITFFDEQRRQMQQRLEAELPGDEIVLTGSNKAEDMFMVRTFSDRSLGSYYIYDLQADTLKKITDVSPWLDEADMAEMEPVSFTARDGLTVHGYLTLPKPRNGERVPIVINPHGGPWVRDSWGYNPEVQLLASRGYGVFQINYRGSTGYGKDFWMKGFKQWGHDMQNDLTDGVHWLIEQGIADPERVAIYGASYGGYATLAGIAFTPDLYACAVDYVGVSNLFTFMETIPPYWKPYLDMLYEMVGHPEKDQELLKAGSPVFHIDQIKTPLLVVQGANDPRVKIDESDQIVRSMRERGIDVPYLVKYNEGHGFSNEENRFEFYKAMLGFLAKHIKTQP